MANINQVITLGVGTPSAITQLVLVGLSMTTVVGGTFDPAWAVNSNQSIGPIQAVVVSS